VAYRDAFKLVEAFSTTWTGPGLEPGLLLGLRVVVRDRQSRQHRGRGLGLL